MNDTSIVLDASNYIKELKHKVQILNEEIATTESSTPQNMWPVTYPTPQIYMSKFKSKATINNS